MRELRAEEELAEDARAQVELANDEAAIVAVWAHLELAAAPGWRFLRRRFLERLWREKCDEVDACRQLLRKAAP